MTLPRFLLISASALSFFLPFNAAQPGPDLSAIDPYILPYVSGNNFSGSVLIKKNAAIIFERSYGLANRETSVPNSAATRFHIASVSMQFTAAAILRLIDQGSLSLDTHLDTLIPEIQDAGKITIRDLLAQRSGLPDINDLPDYNDILSRHQTPESLIAPIKGRPLLFEPGAKYLHEEHTAYNVLARILEIKTRIPFASAIEKLVFRPAGLYSSAVDDDSATPSFAQGYQPEGVYELKPAASIHWSAKSGNASIVTTARDEASLVDAIFNGTFLTPSSRSVILDTSQRIGYGWLRGANKRFNKTAYYMNGRAPGFASFVLYLPDESLTVVVISNIYSSATTSLGYDLAAISLGLAYQKFLPLSAGVKNPPNTSVTFQFGSDFYQPNARLTLEAKGPDLFLLWPTETTALIPVGETTFIDRSYWVEVKLERDAAGRPVTLVYDHFQGKALK
jgi:CubicO group peptidase (beta-lactamase class C family)